MSYNRNKFEHNLNKIKRQKKYDKEILKTKPQQLEMANKFLFSSFNTNNSTNNQNMKKIGQLIKDILWPQKSTHKYLRFKINAKTNKEKTLMIADCVEQLNSNIIVNE